MPIYEFVCRKCDHAYDDLVPHDETGKYPGVSCPQCGSKRKRRKFGACSVKFADPKGTSKWDNFSYRAGYNLEKAQGERRAAEAASHMGSAPYRPVDDISSGEFFGEVK